MFVHFFFLNEHNYYSMSRIFIFLQKSLIFVKMYRILSKTDILLLLIKQMGFKHSLIIFQEQFLIAYEINIFLFLCVVLFALKIKKKFKTTCQCIVTDHYVMILFKKDVLQHRVSFTFFWNKIFLSKDNIIHKIQALLINMHHKYFNQDIKKKISVHSVYLILYRITILD